MSGESHFCRQSSRRGSFSIPKGGGIIHRASTPRASAMKTNQQKLFNFNNSDVARYALEGHAGKSEFAMARRSSIDSEKLSEKRSGFRRIDKPNGSIILSRLNLGDDTPQNNITDEKQPDSSAKSKSPNDGDDDSNDHSIILGDDNEDKRKTIIFGTSRDQIKLTEFKILQTSEQLADQMESTKAMLDEFLKSYAQINKEHAS